MEPPETSASASPAVIAATAWTIEASWVRRTARAGIGVLGDRDRRVDHAHVRGDVADLGRGAEEDDVDARDGGGAACDLSGTEIGPVDVYRDGDRPKVG